MNNKEDFNLTLPIILIGILSVVVLLFFSLFDSTTTSFDTSFINKQTDNQAATPEFYFIAPDRVARGEMAEFSWRAAVSENAVCEGKSLPEGSDGGWSGLKQIAGVQMVGPIEKNTIFFLDCVDGEDVKRDLEIVSAEEPKMLLSVSNETVSVEESVSIGWGASLVDRCELRSGIDEIVADGTTGIYDSGELFEDQTFTLLCYTENETLEQSVTITVE